MVVVAVVEVVVAGVAAGVAAAEESMQAVEGEACVAEVRVLEEADSEV